MVYFMEVRIACDLCNGSKFKNNCTLKSHKKYCHEIYS